MEPSPFLKLNSWDYYKALAVVAISAVMTALLEMIGNKGLNLPLTDQMRKYSKGILTLTHLHNNH